jgi:hypothetical protein
MSQRAFGEKVIPVTAKTASKAEALAPVSWAAPV